LILGCLPSSSPCVDDPNPAHPTLSSAPLIGGSISANDALGILVHNARIRGSVTQVGGGGGFSCVPTGVFANLLGSPVFSAYEDSTIGGNLSLRFLASCWLGVARVHLGGTAAFQANQLADPDAIEILDNQIGRNLECYDNSMVWNSFELTNSTFPRQPAPNTVLGVRRGQCVLASPLEPGGPTGPGPF
jgi:hypothetical protein